MEHVDNSIFRPEAIRRRRGGRVEVVPPRIPGAGAGLFRRRVPVVAQLNAVECGPACLAMILGYHGRKTEVAECRERCDAGRDGVSMLALTQAARSFGLRVKGYRAEPADLRHLPLPAIVHWEFDHYVVVERWSPDTVDIVDPASGRRSLRAAEFEAGFTGVVMTLTPGAALEPARARPASSWTRYLRAYALTAPRILVQALAASLVLQLLGLALPVVSKLLVDHILPQRDVSLLGLFAIGAAAVVLSQVVIGYVRARLLLSLQARVDSRMMPDFFEHLLGLPLRFFEQRSSGDLLMRLSSNTMIRDVLTGQTLSLVLDGALVLVYLAILLARAPLFGLIVGALGLLQIALLLGSSRRMADLAQRDVAAQAESQSYLVEALAGIAALKTSGAEDRAHNHWMDLFSRHIHASLERSRHSAAIDSVIAAIRIGAPLAMLWVGSRDVISGEMSLGTLLALNALGVAFLMPLSSLVQNGQRLPQIRAHLVRLADVMQAEPEQRRGAVKPAPARAAQRIALENVGFRYDEGGPWVLRGVSLTIEPGETVALVGRTGCGKTTLLKLLLGLYPLTEGRILYDGIPLDTIDYRTLRSQIGVVLQDPFLFTGSIRDNIAFGDRSMPLPQIEDGAQMAAIHDDIARMPMGYETRLAEGGAGLSGGQRQRVAIARALAPRPRVVFLDEATSHLDAATERAVEESVRALACTRVVIAHRLSTIRRADRIVVLDQGAIVEQGTHAELLARGGHYAAMVGGQG